MIRARLDGVANEPLERAEVLEAMAPVLELLELEAADVAELHLTGSTVRARVVPRTRRGKRVPGALVTVSRKLVRTDG